MLSDLSNRAETDQQFLLKEGSINGYGLHDVIMTLNNRGRFENKCGLVIDGVFYREVWNLSS